MPAIMEVPKHGTVLWLQQRRPTYNIASTARGFEPLRAEPNGFLVHHLNRSVTLSCRSIAPTKAVWPGEASCKSTGVASEAGIGETSSPGGLWSAEALVRKVEDAT